MRLYLDGLRVLYYHGVVPWLGQRLCFYIARGLGRDAVEKLTSKFALKDIDGFF